MPAHRSALTLLLVLVACSSGSRPGPMQPPPGEDADGDGLADADEVALLRQYRPFWDFDPDEFLFPVSVDDWARAGGRVFAPGGAASVAYADPAGLLAAVQAHPDGVMHPDDPRLEGADPCPPGVACGQGAPVYAEATPLDGRPDRVWLQYWVFFGYDEKDLQVGVFNHRGDWEHVCVLVARGSAGDATADPIGVHFHHHGSLNVVETPEWTACRAGAAECTGQRHARVYVDRGGHGSYPATGTTVFGPHRGGFPSNGGLLETPIVSMLPHPANAGRVDDDVVRTFRGNWGHEDGTTTDPGPPGPLVFNDLCDHDFLTRPTMADWTPACRSQQDALPAR